MIMEAASSSKAITPVYQLVLLKFWIFSIVFSFPITHTHSP